MDLREIGWGCIYWTHLAKGCCEHDNEPSGSITFWEIFE
jgi:hypothetical protein